MKKFAIKYHKNLALLFENNKSFKIKDNRTNHRFLLELPWQLIKAEMWEEVIHLVCNLDFIQAKITAGYIFELLYDYELILKYIPDNRESFNEETNKIKVLKEYADSLINHNAQTNSTLKSIIPWTQEQREAEIYRIKSEPSRLDRLNDFKYFLDNQVNNLNLYSKNDPYFVIQQAYNHAKEGWVSKAAENIIQKNNLILSIKKPLSRNNWEPIPTIIKQLLGHSEKVLSISVTPCFSKAITGGADGKCLVWDLLNGELIYDLKDFSVDSKYKKEVSLVEISNNGSIAISYEDEKRNHENYEKEVIIRNCYAWNLKEGKAIHHLKRYRKGIVIALSISSDNSKGLIAYRDGFCIIWNLFTGEVIKEIFYKDSWLDDAKFSSDGKKLICAFKKEIVVLDIETEELISSFNGHNDSDPILKIISTEKNIVRSCTWENICEWDIMSGNLIKYWEVPDGPSVDITYDGKTIAKTLYWDDDINFGDSKHIVNLGEKDGTLLLGLPFDLYNNLIFSPDGTKLITGTKSGRCLVWEGIKACRENNNEKITQNHHHITQPITDIDIAYKQKWAISSSGDNSCIIWDLHSGVFIRKLRAHKDGVLTFSISPDGKKIITGSKDDTGIIWDIETGNIIHKLEGHSSWVESIKFTPDGNLLITASNKELIIRNTLDYKIIKKIECSFIAPIEIDPTGATMIFGNIEYSGLLVWDLRIMQVIDWLKGHENRFNEIKIAPDGKHAFSCSDDTNCIIWDIQKHIPKHILRDHTKPVKYVALSPDGKLAVSGGEENICILWDMESGRKVKVLKEHTSSITAISFSPDGTKLATGSLDRTCIIWDIANLSYLTRFVCEASITCLNFNSDSIIIGDYSGEVYFFNLGFDKNKEIITPRELWSFKSNKFLLASWRCPACYKENILTEKELKAGISNFISRVDNCSTIDAICQNCQTNVTLNPLPFKKRNPYLTDHIKYKQLTSTNNIYKYEDLPYDVNYLEKIICPNLTDIVIDTLISDEISNIQKDFAREIEIAIKKETSKCRIILIHGSMVDKKSKLLANYIYNNKLELNASHFCNIHFPELNGLNQIIRNLSFQIALQIPKYLSILTYSESDMEKAIKKEPSDLFKYLFIDSLNKITEKNEIHIYIDNIHLSDMKEFFRILDRYQDTLPSWLVFILSSDKRHLLENLQNKASKNNLNSKINFISLDEIRNKHNNYAQQKNNKQENNIAIREYISDNNALSVLLVSNNLMNISTFLFTLDWTIENLQQLLKYLNKYITIDSNTNYINLDIEQLSTNNNIDITNLKQKGHKQIIKKALKQFKTEKYLNDYYTNYLLHHIIELKDFKVLLKLVFNLDFQKIMMKKGKLDLIIISIDRVLTHLDELNTGTSNIDISSLNLTSLKHFLYETMQRMVKFNLSNSNFLIQSAYSYSNIFYPSNEEHITKTNKKHMILKESYKNINDFNEYIIEGTHIISKMAISEDGSKILTTTNTGNEKDNLCYIWDATESYNIGILNAHTEPINCVSITKDGKVGISGGKDNKCIIWDLLSLKPLAFLEAHSNPINSVKITPDGKYAISGGRDSKCIVWDLINKNKIYTIFEHPGSINHVDISHDGKIAISASYNICIAWKTETNEIINQLNFYESIFSISISEDGSIASLVTDDEGCIIWDIINGSYKNIDSYYNPSITVISPNSETIVIKSNQNSLTYFNAKENKIRLYKNPEPINTFDVSFTKNKVILGLEDGNFKVLPLNSLTHARENTYIDGSIDDIFISPEQEKIITNGYKRDIWDLNNPIYVEERLITNFDSRALFDYHRYNNSFISWGGEYSFSFVVWDFKNKELIFPKIEEHERNVSGAVFSPNGRMIYTYNSSLSPQNKVNGIKCWNLLNNCLYQTIVDSKVIEKLYISIDGIFAIISTKDSSRRQFYNLKSNKFIDEIFLTLNDNRDVKFIEDGRTAIFLVGHNSYYYINLRSREIISSYNIVNIENGAIQSIEVLPSGDRFVYSISNEVRIFNLKSNIVENVIFMEEDISSIKYYSGKLYIGTEKGKLHVYTLGDKFLKEKPAIVSITDFWNIKDKTQNLEARCPICDHRIIPNKSIISTIKYINNVCEINENMSPCLNLPDEAWEDKRLLSNCENCGSKLKYNPFIVKN